MTAVQFMRRFEETQNIMESIADKTAHEHKAMLESIIDEEDYTDDAGVFNMGNMLDVEISDRDDMQPQYYNTPIEDLSEGDKALIVNEFTKMLMDMHEEVIDFSDIGPVATVIQNRFGFKQDVEGFLRDTINKASDWQQSQVMSHENETAGEEIAGDAGMTTDGTKAPTDIAPTMAAPADATPDVNVDAAPIEAPVEIIEEPSVEPMPEIAPEEPITDIGAEETDLGTDVGELGTDIAEEGTELTDIGEGEELAGEETTDLGETTEEIGDVAEEIGGDVDEAGETDESEETGEEKEDEKEEKEESKDVELQLESIRAEYMNRKKVENLVEDATQSLTTEASVDAQLEAIRATLVEEAAPVETDEEAEIQAYLKDIMSNPAGDEEELEPASDDEIDSIMTEANNQKVIAQLESISAQYHAKEDAKIHAIKRERKLDAALESISAGYHKSIEAQAIAEAKEAELDAKLNSLVESYQASKKANLKSRQETRQKLDELKAK